MHSKNNVHWIGIDHDWKQRLESNPWSRFFKGNPFDHFYGAETLNMLNLRQKILDYAGEDVCLPFGYNDLDPFGSVLLQYAQPFELKEAIKADFMPTNMCYVNNCYIVNRYPELFELCYGFYMDEKGMWREHAWVVTKNNRMVELTNTGNAYFGINLTQLGLDKGFIAMQINDNTIRDYCQFDEEIYDFVDFINEVDKKHEVDEKTRIIKELHDLFKKDIGFAGVLLVYGFGGYTLEAVDAMTDFELIDTVDGYMISSTFDELKKAILDSDLNKIIF